MGRTVVRVTGRLGAKAGLFPPLLKAPAPLHFHYISRGKLQGLSDLQIPHLSEPSEACCGDSVR